MHARRPEKICAIRAFVPNAGDGSGGTLDETGIRYASLHHREVYCVRVDRQFYVQTEKSRCLGFLLFIIGGHTFHAHVIIINGI